MKNKLYNIRLFITILVTALLIFAFLGGVYPFKLMDSQFSALLQRLINNYSVSALVIFISAILVTLIFGRIYCSILCPLGILQRIALAIFDNKSLPQQKYMSKYFIAAIYFGALIGGSVYFIKYLDPYSIFGMFISLSIIGIIIVVILISLVFFKNLFFCTNICPVGTILGLISKCSINKIYIDKDKCISCQNCAKSCPSGCINIEDKNIENDTCIKCLKCLTACNQNAINYGIKPKENTKFNIKRRNLIIGTSAILLFGASIKTISEFTKNAWKEIKSIILPPGASNKKRMLNMCLNCNLCVQNCPTKILTKSNNDFATVHIDYSKGQGYCKYDCNECSKVCPSGAIKRIQLSEKQKTKIAVASVTKHKCIGCGACVYACPKNCIEKKDGIIISKSKCIGCGKCKTACKYNAINIYPVEEQNII